MTKPKCKSTSALVRTSRISRTQPMDYRALVKAIESTHHEMKGRAVAAVNQALVLRNWVIGRFIIEFQQRGSDRAAYGEGLLRRLSTDLIKRKVHGSSPDMLERARKLYLCYPQFASVISAAVPRISEPATARDKLEISAAVSRKSLSADPSPLPPARLALLSSVEQLKALVESDRARLENLQSKREKNL